MFMQKQTAHCCWIDGEHAHFRHQLIAAELEMRLRASVLQAWLGPEKVPKPNPLFILAVSWSCRSDRSQRWLEEHTRRFVATALARVSASRDGVISKWSRDGFHQVASTMTQGKYFHPYPYLQALKQTFSENLRRLPIGPGPWTHLGTRNTSPATQIIPGIIHCKKNKTLILDPTKKTYIYIYIYTVYIHVYIYTCIYTYTFTFAYILYMYIHIP